jgi:hypothetical protein
MNAIYAELIERLTWLENRHATLGESNLLKDKEVGVMQSDITTEQKQLR